jgi:hypothetical protein
LKPEFSLFFEKTIELVDFFGQFSEFVTVN